MASKLVAKQFTCLCWDKRVDCNVCKFKKCCTIENVFNDLVESKKKLFSDGIRVPTLPQTFFVAEQQPAATPADGQSRGRVSQDKPAAALDERRASSGGTIRQYNQFGRLEEFPSKRARKPVNTPKDFHYDGNKEGDTTGSTGEVVKKKRAYVRKRPVATQEEIDLEHSKVAAAAARNAGYQYDARMQAEVALVRVEDDLDAVRGLKVDLAVLRNNPRSQAQRKRNLTGVTQTQQTAKKVSAEKVPACAERCCAGKVPVCLAKQAARCSREGWASGWVHVSQGEHFCIACCELFSKETRSGHAAFTVWLSDMQLRSRGGQVEFDVLTFLVDQFSPYYLQCARCGKWRRVPRDRENDVSVKLSSRFNCSKLFNKDDACDVGEDRGTVDMATAPSYLTHLAVPLYLRESVLGQFLENYPPEEVGLAPISQAAISACLQQNANHLSIPYEPGEAAIHKQVDELCPYLEPFLQPGEAPKARGHDPTRLSEDELADIPEAHTHSQAVLLIRNLIVALWTLSPKKWLTASKVQSHLLCRGLSRMAAVTLLPKVLWSMSRRGVVNIGYMPKLHKPLNIGMPPRASEEKEHVIVIGAGPAGIAAAVQLQHYGVKVTVLEASERLGGRVHDVTDMGVCVGLGAHILNGYMNNPMALLCHQMKVPMRSIQPKCDLLTESGTNVPTDTDEKMDYYFSSLLENVEQRRLTLQKDCSLYELLMERHNAFKSGSEGHVAFTAGEEKLLQQQFSQLECASGGTLHQMSALFHDHNDYNPSFGGDHTMMTRGYGLLLQNLATNANLRIKYKAQVTSVEYGKDMKEIKLRTEGGQKYQCTRVICTVPLGVLKHGDVTFSPALPSRKREAIRGLGAGVLDKVVMEFPTRFWESRIGGADFFGHVPEEESQRGMFGMFYDLTPAPPVYSCEMDMAALQAFLMEQSQLQSEPNPAQGYVPLAIHGVTVEGPTQMDDDVIVPLQEGYSLPLKLDVNELSGLPDTDEMCDINSITPSIGSPVSDLALLDRHSPAQVQGQGSAAAGQSTAIHVISGVTVENSPAASTSRTSSPEEEVGQQKLGQVEVGQSKVGHEDEGQMEVSSAVVDEPEASPAGQEDGLDELADSYLSADQQLDGTRDVRKSSTSSTKGRKEAKKEKKASTSSEPDHVDEYEQKNILMTFVSGEAVQQVESLTDEEIVNMCVQTLQKMFPNEAVPAPIRHMVTRWGRWPFSRMSYSFVKVGGSPANYDELATPVDNRLFFAGEHTDRYHQQTVCGAYLSGVREASRILKLITKETNTSQHSHRSSGHHGHHQSADK